jgi:esterase/lipase superfamily enzyme
MDLVGWFKDRFRKQADHWTYVKADPLRCHAADGTPADSKALTAGDDYFRLWLCEMYLKNNRDWFSNWHPAVATSVRFQYGNHDETVTHLAGESRLKDVNNKNLDRVIGLNYPLTALVPFQGGTIELDAGLLALQGGSDVKAFLKVLGDFSNLLVVPQLSTALSIAGPLADGIAELVGATNGALELGLHDTWATQPGGGANILRAGYIVAVLASTKQLDPTKFWVVDGRLKYGSALPTATPLTGFHYMLFRVERRDQRDDWDALTAIQEPFRKAIETLSSGNNAQAEIYLRQAKVAAFNSLELTENVDKRRVVEQLQKRFDARAKALGVGAFKPEETRLSAVMYDAMKTSLAKAKGPLLEDEVFGTLQGAEISGGIVREGTKGARLYTVWYGTNRHPIDPNDSSRGFSGKRSDQVRYGTCAVAIPRSHKFGSVGSPWWKRLLVLTDDRLKVRELRPQNQEEFFGSLRSAIGERSVRERQAVLYLHGYNTSFDEAAIRAAQIGFDLKVPGVMAFFSWPSQGMLNGYAADEASIEASEGVITDFMVRLATESSARKLHVIAHSMGNRGLLRALQRIEARAQQRSEVKFGQIFLAAPDIDAGQFEELAYLYPLLSKRTTLYVSSGDKALGASTWLHGHRRVGFTPPVTVVNGIDTIEVTGLDVTMLGHGYYAEAAALLHDMFDLLRHDVPPTQRQRLTSRNISGGLTYWSFQS